MLIKKKLNFIATSWKDDKPLRIGNVEGKCKQLIWRRILQNVLIPRQFTSYKPESIVAVNFTVNIRPQTRKITFPWSFSLSIMPDTKKVLEVTSTCSKIKIVYEEKYEEWAPL